MIEVQTSLLAKVAKLTKALYAVSAKVTQRPVVQVIATNSAGNFVLNAASIQLPVTLVWPVGAKWCRIDVVPDLTVSVSRTLTNGVIPISGSATLTVPGGGQTSSVNSDFVVENSALTLASRTTPISALVGIISLPSATLARIDWTFVLSGAAADITSAQYVCSAKFFVTYFFNEAPLIT